MPKLTYLLGAGASFHSIPVVNTMNERMKLFLNMLENYRDYQNRSPGDAIVGNFKDMPPLYKVANPASFDKYKNVVEEAIKHKTVDTYARKLFLRKKPDDAKKLELLKEFLCLYFAFEQSVDKTKLLLGSPTDYNKVVPYIKHQNHINTPLDDRYDVFMATLLKDDLTLPEDISIISWNYDHQVELSYMDYADCSLDDARKRLGVFPLNGGSPKKLIKLNGSASQEVYNRTSGPSQSLTLRTLNSYQETLHHFLKPEESHAKMGGEHLGTSLTFAWENHNYIDDAIKEAQLILSMTDELVIIGYSFPNFNRKVDIEIFKDVNVPVVNVQCGEGDYKAIKENMKDINERLTINITEREDLSQFYIPKTFLA